MVAGAKSIANRATLTEGVADGIVGEIRLLGKSVHLTYAVCCRVSQDLEVTTRVGAGRGGFAESLAADLRSGRGEANATGFTSCSRP